MHAILLMTLMFFQQSVVYSGTSNNTDIDLPRIETSITIDGILSEDVWSRAARLTDFSQYQPVDGRPASDPTEVLVWYSPDAIYFGIRATELHGDVVRATRANRDNISSEDQIQILLDTQNDNKIGYLFSANPLGVQADGTRADQFGGGAGGRSATGGGSNTINFLDGNVDLNPDYVFESAGHLTQYGYELEFRIPFKSLRYQAAEVQDWGLHVLRKIQHSGFQDSWAPAIRANASFLSQSGKLKGMTGMRRGLVLDLTPTATNRLDGAPDPKGDWKYGNDSEFGADVKWGIRQNLTLNATLNPDFSQVEADVGQVVLNERFALFFPEKRPFFLEGLELFDTPGQMIYTRRIVAPVIGSKLGGKIGKLNVATILAADDKKYSASGDDVPVFGVARLRRDLSGNNTVGAVLTAREESGDYSRLAGLDSRLYHGQKYYVEMQAVASFTELDGASSSGSFTNLTWDRTGRTWGFNYGINAISPDFEAAVGFVNRTGIIRAQVFNRLSFYGDEGALIETIGGFGGVSRIWDYDAASAGPIEGSETLFPSATLRGGWRLNGSLMRNFFSYDPGNYEGYTSTICGTVSCFQHPIYIVEKETNQFGASIGVTTPTFQYFTASVLIGKGRTPLFAEASPGRFTSYSFVLDARPTSSLRASFQMAHFTLHRKLDDSKFSSEIIPRLKLEYQFTPSVFFRVIGQYASRERSALRDRAGALIHINGLPTTESRSKELRTDWLFSYRPTPGTLIYLGYGSTMDDVGQERLRDLRRRSDGFFMKLSYLFHVQ